MPLLETKGAASAQGFGLTLGGEEAVYVEDVFSTYLYTGNGSTQTITNGIDLSGEGGLVWLKLRSGPNAVSNHALFDTSRGAGNRLATNTTDANFAGGNLLTAFTNSGFVLDGSVYNDSSNAPVSWTFRKQPKFFDVVTYTGDGAASRSVSHALGSVPGCIIIKRTDSSSDWPVYHRGNPFAPPEGLALNLTASTTSTYRSLNSTPTATEFVVGAGVNPVNANGGTYVAYLFAHDAGGFGDDGTENVISCGSYTGDGSSGQNISLGYEPQWVLTKRTDTTGYWNLYDVMRGQQVEPRNSSVGNPRLAPNVPDAEIFTASTYPIQTGFNTGPNNNVSGGTYIYIAIRRGPMKVPTSGTSVLGLSARSGTGANATVSGGQIADAALIKNRGSAVGDLFAARLTGTGYLETSSTAAEVAAGTTILQANPWDVMDGVKVGTTSTITNASSNTFINYLFRRAPGFFDVVCYTGTGSVRTVSHNLGAVPELMIVKKRSAADAWVVYANNDNTDYLVLNTTAATVDDNTIWNDTSPTSSVFTVGTNDDVNGNTATFVAYLFATVAGVSKVFSFTGNGSSQTINCGFTAGARFVLIKRTDSTGSWYCWDSARGIVASNDPHLSLNTTAAEVTTDDSVDADSTGFVVNQNSATNVNVNGATYIGLAVA